MREVGTKGWELKTLLGNNRDAVHFFRGSI